MEIKHQAKVDFGGGTIREIIEELKKLELPDDAVLIKVEDESYVEANDDFVIKFIHFVRGTFEWRTE